MGLGGTGLGLRMLLDFFLVTNIGLRETGLLLRLFLSSDVGLRGVGLLLRLFFRTTGLLLGLLFLSTGLLLGLGLWVELLLFSKLLLRLLDRL